MYWIGHLSVASNGQLILLMAFLLIPLWMCFPVLVFLGIKKQIPSTSVWLLFPICWVAYEYLHSHWELAFTWLHLGFGLTPFPSLIQFYQTTGPLGGTLFILTINVFVFLGIIKWSDTKWRRRLTIGFSLILVAYLISNFGSNQSGPKEKVKVAVVQANIDPYVDLTDKSVEEQVQLIVDLTEPLNGKNLNLIVCSEGLLRGDSEHPIILNTLDKNPSIDKLKELSQELDAPILIGVIGVLMSKNQGLKSPSSIDVSDDTFYDLYNGALLIAHNAPIQFQAKNKLVPFMERVPFLSHTGFFESLRLSINQMRSSYGRTDKANVFSHENLRIAPIICRDANFPDYVRKFIENGSNILAVIANDGWAGSTAGYQQNAAYSKAIAISMRRSIARSANTGESLFIDAEGNSYQNTNWGEQKVIVRELDVNQRLSFYAVYGDYLGVLSLAVLILTAFLVILKRVMKIA